MLSYPHILIGIGIALLIIYVLGVFWAYNIASNSVKIVNGEPQPPAIYVSVGLLIGLTWPLPVLFVGLALFVQYLADTNYKYGAYTEPVADIKSDYFERMANRLGFYETNFSERRWRELLADIRYGFDATYLERKYK